VGSRRLTASAMARPAIQWVVGAVSPGVKRQLRQTDHSQLNSSISETVRNRAHEHIHIHLFA
jgi:hypothetical protein